MKELQAVIHGKVQQVGYRAFVKAAAAELGLDGYIENLDDGTVEVVAQGDELALIDFVEKLKEGSYWSDVRRVVSAIDQASDPLDKGFAIVEA